MVRDGDAWWLWEEAIAARSNEGDLRAGYGDGRGVSLMLDPKPLLGALRSTPHSGRGSLPGRETITADAVARLSDPRHPPRVFELHQLGSGADRYMLQVDAERGVLLEAVTTRNGEPVYRIATQRIGFDHPIDPERFRFVALPARRSTRVGVHTASSTSLAIKQERRRCWPTRRIT